MTSKITLGCNPGSEAGHGDPAQFISTPVQA